MTAAERPSVAEISLQDAAQLIARSDPPVVVDVRQPGEFRSGHLAGARSHPLLGGVCGASDYDRSRPVILVCASGHRSLVAARLLQLRGFRQLLSLHGETTAWQETGLPLE